MRRGRGGQGWVRNRKHPRRGAAEPKSREVSAILPDALDHSPQTAPLYGSGRAEVVGTAGWEWLEAAVLAGHLPHFEGVSLVVRATHLMWLKEVEQAHRAGVDGDALGWTEGADAYRNLIVLPEECVREMELERAKLLELPVPDSVTEPEQARRDGAGAEAARQRALRAQERSRSAARDQSQEN